MFTTARFCYSGVLLKRGFAQAGICANGDLITIEFFLQRDFKYKHRLAIKVAFSIYIPPFVKMVLIDASLSV